MDKKVYILCDKNILKTSVDINDDNCIVFHENFSEGAVSKDVGSDEFWKKRYSFYKEKYKISKLDYYDMTIREFVKFQDVSEFDEIFLLFNTDISNQINMLAICSYLLQSFRKDVKYSLVYIDSNSDKNTSKNKINLSRTNLEFAQEFWNVFAGKKIEKVKEINFNKSPKFPHLQNAMDSYFSIIPNG